MTLTLRRMSLITAATLLAAGCVSTAVAPRGDTTAHGQVTIKRDDLIGNFDLEVDISTAEVDNQKSQDLGFMLQTLGPNMDPKVSMMIL